MKYFTKPTILKNIRLYSTNKGIEAEQAFSYMLARNLVVSGLPEESDYLAIKSITPNNRGIFALSNIPKSTKIIEEVPITSSLKKLDYLKLKSCPQCLQPKLNNQSYCSTKCESESMGYHHIKEVKDLSLKFQYQLRVFPTLILNLIFECLVQFKTEKFSPVYYTLPHLAFVTHKDIPELWKQDYEAIKEGLLRDPSRVSYFSLEWYVRMMSVLDLNSFSIPDPEKLGRPWASALYLLGSMINHSCIPNCDVRFVGNKLQVISNRVIKEGEEISIAYLDTDKFNSHKDVHEFLNRKYGFKCNCPICRDMKLASIEQ